MQLPYRRTLIHFDGLQCFFKTRPGCFCMTLEYNKCLIYILLLQEPGIFYYWPHEVSGFMGFSDTIVVMFECWYLIRITMNMITVQVLHILNIDHWNQLTFSECTQIWYVIRVTQNNTGIYTNKSSQ